MKPPVDFARVPDRRELAKLAVLTAGGLLGNHLNAELLFGVQFIFGGIFVMMAVRMSGPVWGALVGLVVGSYTLWLWQHPYAMIIFTLEAFAVGCAMRWRRESMVMADGLYWLFIGIPLAYAFYRGGLDLPWIGVKLIMFKQAINGVFNTVVAVMLMEMLARRSWGRRFFPVGEADGWSIRSALKILFILFALLPAIMAMVLTNRSRLEDVRTDLRHRGRQIARFVQSNITGMIDVHLSLLAASIDAEFRRKVSAQEFDVEVRHGLFEKWTSGAIPGLINMAIIRNDGTVLYSHPYQNHTILDTDSHKAAMAHGYQITNAHPSHGGIDRPHFEILLPLIKSHSVAYATFDTRIFEKALRRQADEESALVQIRDAAEHVVAGNAPSAMPPDDGGGDEPEIIFIGNSGSDMENWLDAYFRSTFSFPPPIPWRLTVYVPLRQSILRIQEGYASQFSLYFSVLLLAMLLAMPASRQMGRPLCGLATVAARLAESDLNTAVTWPKSAISEIASLTRHFRLLVAENQRRQRELAQTAGELRALIETANAPILGVDELGRVNQWNRKAADLTGYPPEEAMGRDLVVTFIAEGSKTSVRKVFNQALGGIETASFEFPLNTRSGRRVLILLNATPRWNMHGRISGVVGVGQEITRLVEDREQLERMVRDRTAALGEALAEAERGREWINAILNGVGDGIIVTTLGSRVLLMNPAAEKWLTCRRGGTMADCRNASILDHTLRDKIEKTAAGEGVYYEFDFELLPAENGAAGRPPRVMRGRTAMMLDAAGKPTGVVTVFNDVTAEREVDRLKSEFVSTAAHELRTPLTSIQGFSEILSTRPNLTDAQKVRFMKHINEQAVQLGRIVNDLLDLSRIESGVGHSMEYRTVAAEEIIRRDIDHYQGLSDRHDISLALDSDETSVEMDPDKVGQVIRNLLSNALKFSPGGGPIHVRGERRETAYRICVSDRGIGMTPDQSARIFDKFYRADASNSAPEGTGLGMAIVKHIVEAHRGRVWVESEYGAGATICFDIPLKRNISLS